MTWLDATVWRDRIAVRSVREQGVDDFAWVLAASKRVLGGQFSNRGGVKFWHYPLSVDTCVALRNAFGTKLRVSQDLAAWYRTAAAEAADHTSLTVAEDAVLQRVPPDFANWLRAYQRTGARWIAEGYRGAGLVADEPGLGKTPETLAAMLEAGVQGPVLVVCPKASVKSVWGNEARQHLRGVPVYLCRGTRAKREHTLDLFAKHMTKNPNRLRILVVVAEMLRVELGNPCFTAKVEFNEAGQEVTVPVNKVSGMCPGRFRTGECTRHIQVPPPEDSGKAAVKKWLVPVDFTYPDLFDPKLLGGGWAWIVLDEAHKLLGSLSVVSANLMGRALKLLPERQGRRRYALTGTPFGQGGKVQGMFGTLHWLWPDEYTSYWKWVAEVMEVREKVVNRYGKTVKEIVGLKGIPTEATPEAQSAAWENFMKSLGPRVLRRTKQEKLPGLPAKVYAEITCELSAGQRKQLAEMAEWAEVQTPGGVVTVNGTLALRTRDRQLANGCITMGEGKVRFTQESGKLDRLWEMLDARGIIDGAPGFKLVVASGFNEFLDAVQTMLRKDKVPHYRLDGSVSMPVRESMQEAWQANERMGALDWAVPPRVMLVQTKAAGISINLDAADEMHILDEDPDPGVNTQLEDRIHRASRVHNVTIFYYRTEGTIEHKAAHDVEYRRRLQHAILDERRGVEYLRTMISEQLEEL